MGLAGQRLRRERGREVVEFEASGPQTIRIQTKEDGLRIDQIVLSSGGYQTAAPGADDRPVVAV